MCALLLVATVLPRHALGADSLTVVPPGPYTNAELRRLWKPVADDVYLQEVGEKVRTTQPVTGLALYQDTLYAVTGGALKALRQGALQDVPGAPAGIRRLRSLGGALWAAAEGGNYRFASNTWQRIDEKPMIDFCLHLGQVHGATTDDLFRFENGRWVNIKPATGYLSNDDTLVAEDFSQVLADPVTIGPVLRIASYSGTLYFLRPGGLALLDEPKFVPDPVDWGTLPSPVTRDLLTLGNRVYVATDRGLGVLRGMALTSLRGADGLPFEDTTCLAEGFDGDLWIGTSTGAIRKVGDEYQYFGPDLWLPGNHVHDIAAANRAIYIATDCGLGIIRYEPYTLLKKEAYFERDLNEWGFQRLGFIHKLYWAGDAKGWLREISDNDGGNSSYYLSAMTFKYAATGDEAARQEALETFKALVWLDEIKDRPGFIARAVWSVKGDEGARSTRGSGGLPAKWYPTDDGLWLWKGDTSSDEVNAHFYAVSLFHDLAAKGKEKDRAAQHLANIATHILDNGWVLRDMDGQPTRWGRWDTNYLERPYGIESRGLNGMEAQTYMTTAYAMTGDPKFLTGLEQLLKWRYHTYTVRQKLTFPPDSIVPWDDELAFNCYGPLLRYAHDPYLRSIYLRSIERSWEVLRMQQVPFFNFMYGALTGNDCEVPEAVRNLREWPLELVNYSYRNSHRADLGPRPGYVPYARGTRAMSPRETDAKWDVCSSIEYDGGQGGKGVTPPTRWLMDYWMGRYYGFIEAPKTADTEATALPPRTTTRRVAAPYAGPPRPPGKWEK
jgi:hypothetical protein